MVRIMLIPLMIPIFSVIWAPLMFFWSNVSWLVQSVFELTWLTEEEFYQQPDLNFKVFKEDYVTDYYCLTPSL